MNQGQMCVAGSRLLIHEKCYPQFLSLLKQKLSQFTIGRGDSYTTDMGPLVSKGHQEKVENMVKVALENGAIEEFGQKDIQIPAVGFFFPPTVLSNVDTKSEIWKEEVFGPVLIIKPFENDEEALALANDSEFGLSASIWTNDIYRIHNFSRNLQVGNIWVNTYGSFSPEVPFGGAKRSGFGKELGMESLMAYSQKKSIIMDITKDNNPLVSGWYGY